MKSEHLSKTENAKIFIEQQTPIDQEKIMTNLIQLDEAVTRGYTSEELVYLMRRMVETYHDPNEVNCQAVEKIEAAERKTVIV